MPVPASALCYGNSQQGCRPGCAEPGGEEPERSPENRAAGSCSAVRISSWTWWQHTTCGVFLLWNELELFTSSWLPRPNSA